MKESNQQALGLIADGNRRWARAQKKPVSAGHAAGFEVIRKIIVPVLYDHPDWDTFVVYAFSTENWGRSPSEVKNLMKLFSHLDEWGKELAAKDVQFVHAGRKDRLPSPLLKKITNLESATKNNTAFRVIVCLDYGSHDEMVRAVESGGVDFVSHLAVPPLDLIVRTGGEQRLSNFCLHQAAYAELCFTKTFLPDLDKTELDGILENFAKRDKRKGV